MEQYLEWILKAVLTIAASLLVFTFKEFRSDLKALVSSLKLINDSMVTLTANDKHKDLMLSEIKQSIAANQKEIDKLKQRVTSLEVRTEE